jgi:hypothetical protein
VEQTNFSFFYVRTQKIHYTRPFMFSSFSSHLESYKKIFWTYLYFISVNAWSTHTTERGEEIYCNLKLIKFFFIFFLLLMVFLFQQIFKIIYFSRTSFIGERLSSPQICGDKTSHTMHSSTPCRQKINFKFSFLSPSVFMRA